MSNFNESNLEDAIIDKFKDKGYDYIEGHEIERDPTDVILDDYFRMAVERINHGVSDEILNEALSVIKNINDVRLEDLNFSFYKYLIEGVPVSYREDSEDKTFTVKLIDFENPLMNDFMVVNQLTIDDIERKRPDIIVFINGIPMVVFELKNPADEKTTIKDAYDQIKVYQDSIKSLFIYNVFNVICDGIDTKVGTITSDFTRYMSWKSVNGEDPDDNVKIYLNSCIDGMFEKDRLVDIIRNFIVFKDNNSVKILADYHQYFAVKKAVDETHDAMVSNSDKIGVIWHTQGSGKSFSMFFYTGIIVRDPEFRNPTIVVVTDRNDLDNQLFNTFNSNSNLFLRQTPHHANSRKDLKDKLSVKVGGIIFTTIHKFEESDDIINERDNIIVIVDEAHRSQYGLYGKVNQDTGELKYGMAKNMRDALPNAKFIAFTGTPINKKDKSTREVFGDYIDTYDMTQAVDDGATVPIYYERRISKIKFNDKILKIADDEYNKLSNYYSQIDIEQSKNEVVRQFADILDSDERVNMIADDIITHYEEREDILTGKAMIVCHSRKNAIKLYKSILKKRPNWTSKVKVVLTSNHNDPKEWHDIIETDKEKLAIEFKDDNSKFKIAIVVDMWLTGFDVPSLATMYIDKPMREHNLMQAIARVNRTFPDKKGGLIVDYIGIWAALEEAMCQYTQRDQDKIVDIDEVYKIVMAELEVMRDYFHGYDYLISKFMNKNNNNEDRLDAINAGINHTLGFSYGDEERFIKHATKLTQDETLCKSILSEDEIREIEYFRAVKVGLCKIRNNNNSITTNEINSKIIKLINKSIKEEGIFNIFEIEGSRSSSEIPILSEDFFKKIRSMKYENISIEILKREVKLSTDRFSKISVLRAEEFSKKMEEITNRYNERMITSNEAIKEFITLSKEIMEEENEAKGLTSEEFAFYEILTKDPDVLKKMEDEVLVEMAQELTKTIQENKTIDWDKKNDARARMRRAVKRLLKKYEIEYGYPSDKSKEVFDIIIQQVDLQCEN